MLHRFTILTHRSVRHEQVQSLTKNIDGARLETTAAECLYHIDVPSAQINLAAIRLEQLHLIIDKIIESPKLVPQD